MNLLAAKTAPMLLPVEPSSIGASKSAMVVEEEPVWQLLSKNRGPKWGRPATPALTPPSVASGGENDR